MAFFEYCAKCQKFFQSKETWGEHLAKHHAATAKKAVPMAEVDAEKKLEAQVAVPGADPAEIEDARVAKTKDLRAIKKELKKAGIECQTMNAEEARAAYDKAKADGLIQGTEEGKNA